MIRVIRSSALTPEELAALDGAPVLDPEGLDAAIIGTMLNEAGEPVLVYGYDDLVDIFAEEAARGGSRRARDLETAEEWVEYNTLRALPYMGPRAPVVLRRLDDPADVDPEEVVMFKHKAWVRA